MRLSYITAEHISQTLRSALQTPDLITPNDHTIIFYDLSHIDARVEALRTAFPAHTLHAIAVKANPLLRILERIGTLDVGAEAATQGEIYLSQQANIPAEKIVYDSPAKTRDEIRYALAHNIHINADSLMELQRIDELLASMETHSTIGVRINPQVGMGSIAATSVAGEYSKFGVPINEYRQDLIHCFEQYPWLTCVHCHIGSQGTSLDLLLDGLGIILEFVEQVNQSSRRITTIDIGGGLPISYHGQHDPIDVTDYVEAIQSRFPMLFKDYRIITEFGRYVHAHAGWVASRVEYVKRDQRINTAMIHVGADMFLRKCYRPDDWHHDILVLDTDGNLKTGIDDNPYTIAGPLCFSGDIIAREIDLPIIEENDFVIVRDVGAYTLSMWSRYNSRMIPKVLGYDDKGTFETLRARENLEDIARFWQ